ncbi:hypothetical protein [Streptomyces sp. NPDC050504]|uniref:hypothetical protein n=1 Tax=Streptomyces sp. NPDC050504 TaxID=3365618 RepID=UPI003797EDF9
MDGLPRSPRYGESAGVPPRVLADADWLTGLDVGPARGRLRGRVTARSLPLFGLL